MAPWWAYCVWAHGAYGVGTCLLRQPPEESCSAIPGWWGQHLLLPGPRGWQLLTSLYPSSPSLNLSLLSLTPDLAVVRACPQGSPPPGFPCVCVCVGGAVCPAVSAQPDAAGGGFALGRS